MVNLIPGQYEIGGIVMGRGTAYKITGFDIQPYGVAAQDYQAPLEDIVRFGNDQITPGPINMNIEVLQNRWISEKPDTGQYLIQGSLPDLARVWRSDEIRYKWGEMIPLSYCGRDKVTKVIYGRPGKFTYTKGTFNEDGKPTHQSYECIAEFRRADSFSYAANETFAKIDRQKSPTVIWQNGDAPAWVRVVLYGPITDPVITIGEEKLELDIALGANELMEISSYPWRRRVVDSNGVNRRASLTGVNYLNRLTIDPFVKTSVRWTSAEINTFIPALGNKRWYETIDDINYKNLPDSFTNITGKVVVGFDLFNPQIFTRFLRAGIWNNTSACIYNEETFNTRKQETYATLVNPYGVGRSGIAIMCNATMTNYVLLEVNSSQKKLKIRTGSGPTTWSTVRAEWTNPYLFGFQDTDVVGIRATDSGGSSTYTMTFNGADVGTPWTDSGNVVSTASTNRHEGFIFDMDGNLFTHGCGFHNIVGFDNATIPTPVGGAYIFWRDAYQVIE